MIHEQPLQQPRHELFCQVYCKLHSSIKAYKEVFPNASERTASKGASSLMQRADIRKRIDEIMVRGVAEYEDLRRRLVNEMTVCAMYDFNEIYDLKKMSLHDIESIDGRLIHECKQNRDGTYTVKLVDKLKAIEMLGRHLALFQDKVDVTSNGAQISVTVNSPEVKEALDAALND